MRKTKIICTLGPAVDSPEVLERLILAGMNVGRINFSHGNYQDQEERIENFKKVRAKVGKKVSLMLDTKGPEIRIGKFANDEIVLDPFMGICGVGVACKELNRKFIGIDKIYYEIAKERIKQC